MRQCDEWPYGLDQKIAYQVEHEFFLACQVKDALGIVFDALDVAKKKSNIPDQWDFNYLESLLEDVATNLPSEKRLENSFKENPVEE